MGISKTFSCTAAGEGPCFKNTDLGYVHVGDYPEEHKLRDYSWANDSVAPKFSIEY